VPTTTTNYGLLKPIPFDLTDADIWGGMLNTNFDIIDTQLKRGLDYTALSKGGNYTILDTDQKALIAANASTASFTITLPLASNAGFTTTIKKVDTSANTVTIQGNGSELIDGFNTFVLTSWSDAITLISTGTEWLITSKDLSKVGIIEHFGGLIANIPARTLGCDGSAVSRTTYAPLFSKIGTLWGVGDGSTTFNLPLLNEGYFLRGISTNTSVDPSGPRLAGTSQAAALQDHSHTIAAQTTSVSGGATPIRILEGGGLNSTNGSSIGGAETRPVNKAVAFVINY